MGEPFGRTYIHLLIWVLVGAGLILISRFSLPLFHYLAGLFSVVIAIGLFIVAWNSRSFLKNPYLLFLGIAYLFVGALNLLHILAYEGMGVFPGFGADLPNQLGLAARGLESISLCLAPLCFGRRVHPGAVFAGYLAAFAAIMLTIFFWRPFPLGIGGTGPALTALQQTGDSVTSVFLLGAMVLLWRRREEFDPEVLRLLLGAIALAVGSEAVLSFWAPVSHRAHVAGDLLKILSLALIYRALIATELRRPYDLLFNNVRLSEAMVRQEREFADGLMETAQVMVLVLDSQGRIVRLNRAGEDLTGHSLAQVQGRPFGEIFPAPKAVGEGGDGSAPLASGDFSQAYESDWVARDGARRRIAWSSTALPEANGTAGQVIWTGIDITDRLEADKRLRGLQVALERQIQGTQEQARQQEIVTGELDQLTDLVAHELKPLLRWISAYCQALEKNGANRLDLKGRRYLRRLQAAIQQTRHLSEALAYQCWLATTEIHKQKIDLSAQAQTIAAELQGSAPSRQVEFIIGPGLTAEGDPIMLRAVLANLLENAWQFTARVPQGRIEFGAWPAAADWRGFLVRDNRPGVDLANNHHGFAALQRLPTTRNCAGNRIVLATVQRIIQRHGGRLWAEIDHSQGATFFFTLPQRGRGLVPDPPAVDQPNPATD